MDSDIASIVCPTKGRDKGRLFFVIDKENDYLYLADGRMRPLERPKRKKIKHVEPTGLDGGRVAHKLINKEKVTNTELRKTLAALDVSVTDKTGLGKEGEQFAERGFDRG